MVDPYWLSPVVALVYDVRCRGQADQESVLRAMEEEASTAPSRCEDADDVGVTVSTASYQVGPAMLCVLGGDL